MTEPLPPTDRLTAVLTSRFAALPEPAGDGVRAAVGQRGLPVQPAGLDHHGGPGMVGREQLGGFVPAVSAMRSRALDALR